MPLRRMAAAVAVLAALNACGESPQAGTGSDWPQYDGGYTSTRFSNLTEITPENVDKLGLQCTIRLGDDGAFQTAPLVIGGTLYVTTSHTTAAFDAATCAKKWVARYVAEQAYVYGANRGAAFLDNRVFRGTGDGRLIAMDAFDGHVLWKIKAVEPAQGLFFSAAPVAWNGMVFIGAAGSDWGVRGRMMAFDAATGKRVWTFYAIPSGSDPGADTWKNAASVATGGGAMWTSVTLDPATGELFVPVGNPAPDWDPRMRPGANLFTDSFVVLDAKSGKLLWWYQLVPHDSHDYDLGAPPALYTDGAGIPSVAAAGKDGFVHLVDRTKRTLRVKTAVATIKNNTVQPTTAGVYTCPGPLGGTEWFGPSVDEARKTLYVGSNDLCGVYRLGGAKDVVGQAFYGGTFKPVGRPAGWITALDDVDGRIKWRTHLDFPNVAGIVSTASGVVFAADMGGNLYAFDAARGAQLMNWPLQGSVAGGIVTYAVNGKQYVAVPNGSLSRFFGGRGSPEIIVMTLNPAQPTVVDVRPSAAPPQNGSAIFQAYCSACHGVAGAGGTAPALRGERKRKNLAQAVIWIEHPAPPMPKLYPSTLSKEQVESVAGYVESL